MPSRSWCFNAKGERAFGAVRIDGQYPPRDAVPARANLAQRDANDVAAEARLADVHPLPGRVRDRNAAEGGFEVLREPKRHLAGRRAHGAADLWFGLVEKCMRASDAAKQNERRYAAN